MKLSNKMYDFLKFMALVALPALAVFYAGLGTLWSIPAVPEVSGTIVLLDTLLGALLQISTSKYNQDDASYEGILSSDGVHPDTGIPNLGLVVTTPPEEILAGKVARFKIGAPPVR